MELFPYKAEHIGEELGDKDYLNNIDEDAIQQKKDMADQGGAPFGQAGGGKKPTSKDTFTVRGPDGDTAKVTQRS